MGIISTRPFSIRHSIHPPSADPFLRRTFVRSVNHLRLRRFSDNLSIQNWTSLPTDCLEWSETVQITIFAHTRMDGGFTGKQGRAFLID